MIQHLQRLLALVMVLLLTLPAVNALAAAEPDNGSAIVSALDNIESNLESGSLDTEQIDAYLTTLTRYRNWAQNCIDTSAQQLAASTAQLDAIGPASKDEAADVRQQRHLLEQEKSAQENRLSRCRVILQRSEQSITASAALKAAQLKKQLLTRGPNFLTLLLDNTRNPAIWLKASYSFVRDNSGLESMDLFDALLLLLAVAVAGAIGYGLRQLFTARLERPAAPETTTERFAHALQFTGRRYSIALLTSAAAAAFLWFHARNADALPFINIVSYGVPLVLVLTATIDLFLRPRPTGHVFGPIPDDLASALSRRLKVLVVLVFIGYLLFATILAQSLPEPAFLLTRGIYGVFVIINLIWISWLLRHLAQLARLILFRTSISGLFIGTLAAELLGYRNLSSYIFRILIGTLIVLGIYALLARLLREQLDSLDRNKGRWRQRLRHWMGIGPDQHVPGLVWLQFLLTLFLWGMLASALIIIWDVPQSTVQQLVGYITNGFAIGSFQIKPIQLVLGIATLVVLLALNSLLKRWLEQEWLSRSQMERGARESMATISSYVGVAIAIILALAVTGMDFSNLALIAGALSVGIGFGMQNIVNNFVSGLILLFERPIKTGDWIVVGGTEGYVRKISIRSTRIQTFDRADVIVPNSELIASSVTNWMFQDITGRVRVPVGVAYGSDTLKVKKLLLDVAVQHPEVLSNGFLAPEPAVLFMAFGDSSLNFELRCHIRNVDKRLTVISELNFAIDQAFRENGIEIPFPQRDLHLRDWPGKPEPGVPGTAD